MKNRTIQMDQIMNFRAFLLAERARLVYGQEGELEVVTKFGGVAADDQAPLFHEQFVAISQRGMNHRKLKLIDAALTNLDRGNLGVCEECGEGIPPKRLTIIPWAAYCVACQEQLEHKKSWGEPELSLTA